eukprot:6183323-Pleurochrysis_carterae.AAC.4
MRGVTPTDPCRGCKRGKMRRYASGDEVIIVGRNAVTPWRSNNLATQSKPRAVFSVGDEKSTPKPPLTCGLCRSVRSKHSCAKFYPILWGE